MTCRPGAAPSEQLRTLLVDRRGRLWLGTTASGLGWIDEPGAEAPAVSWYTSADGLSSDTVWTLVEHPSGDLFVATGRGVDRLRPDLRRVVSRHSTSDGLPRGEVMGALVDRQGQLWFATFEGLARLSAERDVWERPPATLITACGWTRPASSRRAQ